jgi:hypothetical protein
MSSYVYLVIVGFVKIGEVEVVLNGVTEFLPSVATPPTPDSSGINYNGEHNVCLHS